MKRPVGMLIILVVILLVTACKPDGNTIMEENESESYAATSFSIGNPILDLLVTGDDIWVGTSEGVVRCSLATGTKQRYTIEDGLGSNSIRKLAQDSYGNIWAACQLSGVSRFDGTSWQNFTVSDGLINDDVITLESDEQSGVWVSAYWDVSYYDGKKWWAFTNMEPDTLVVGGDNTNNPDAIIIEYVELSAVDVIYADSHRAAWFSNRSAGVTRFDGQTWELFSSENGILEGGVSAITEDKDGNIWFGGSTGISCFDGSEFQDSTIKQHESIIPRPYIEDIKEDEQGNIWVAAYGGGVCCYDRTSWRAYFTEDGLPSNNARLLFIDEDGNLGVITDQGVCRFDGTRWRIVSMEDGLPHGETRTVALDDEGNLWFGSVEGEIKRFEHSGVSQ